MWYIVLLSGLLFVGLVAAIAGYFRNKKLQGMLERGEISEIPEPELVDGECCGQHEVCERDSLLAAVSSQIEYYDDEELQSTGMSQICDDNDCVFAEIFEDGEIIIFTNSSNEEEEE